MDLMTIGKGTASLGLVLLLVGGLLWLSGKAGLPLGNLPGDIRIEGKHISCFAPVVTMVIVSIILTIILNVLLRLLNR
jgi:hypothetical protein